MAAKSVLKRGLMNCQAAEATVDRKYLEMDSPGQQADSLTFYVDSLDNPLGTSPLSVGVREATERSRRGDSRLIDLDSLASRIVSGD